MAKGWHYESGRHSLAAKGVPTGHLMAHSGTRIASKNVDTIPFYVGITASELEDKTYSLGYNRVYWDIRDHIRMEEKRRGERITEDKIDKRIEGFLGNEKPDISKLDLLSYRPSYVLFWQMIDQMEKKIKARGE